MAVDTSDFDINQELSGLPSDAFSSEPEYELPNESSTQIHAPWQDGQRVVAPLAGLKQTTLFGGRAPDEPSSSQTNKVRNYRVDLPPEPPTHHALDAEALKTYVYPTNLGAIRDYQYSIVRNGLFNNTLVALPTGLGKTFIAATIMLNYFRWTKDAQIIFMAPTKPLVAQQVDACFNIVGIPRSSTTLLTGEVNPGLRAEEWASKRVFFMTPQTLDNDLKAGIADPKRIVLLVTDEAHRATGNYAYVKVIQMLRRFNKSFRVLALTATPGSSVEAVQEVIDSLEISKVEIRTEESIDIQQYVHNRNIDQIILDPSEDMLLIQELLSKALKPIVEQLCAQNAFWNRDPLALTQFGLMKAQERWFQSPAGKAANFGVKGMIRSLFGVLVSIAHGIKLLGFHGIGPFFQAMKDFKSEAESKGSKIGKYKKQILDDQHFKKMMDYLQTWINKDDFVGHPKLTCLCDTVLNHFLDAGDGRVEPGAAPSATRIIVFCEYRGSAEDVARTLNRHGPMIRASVFVGQAGTKHSDGMNQATQIETINKFKNGAYNVIVATSIGEEGLDIGQVDLIICYDGSSSPIRMLQRMGRTGRKRAGKVVLLLMRGKEEESFIKANDNYEQMQRMISDGRRFNFHYDLSSRIVPKDITPVVDKKVIDIPLENTQDASLPEPRRRPKSRAKKPPKKFHMPDDVETGFQSVSDMLTGKRKKSNGVSAAKSPKKPAGDQLAVKPPLDRVLLSFSDEERLKERCPDLAKDVVDIDMAELNKFPEFQRSSRPTKFVKHGAASKRLIAMLQSMHAVTADTIDDWKFINDTQPPLNPPQHAPDSPPNRPTDASNPQFPLAISDSEESSLPARVEARPKPQAKRAQRTSSAITLPLESSEGEQDSDLDDFVVLDDATPRPKSAPGKRARPSQGLSEPPPFFQPTQFSATQESVDGDMPDLGTLVSKRQAATEDSEEPVRLGRGKKRRVVEEDTDDE